MILSLHLKSLKIILPIGLQKYSKSDFVPSTTLSLVIFERSKKLHFAKIYFCESVILRNFAKIRFHNSAVFDIFAI